MKGDLLNRYTVRDEGWLDVCMCCSVGAMCSSTFSYVFSFIIILYRIMYTLNNNLLHVYTSSVYKTNYFRQGVCLRKVSAVLCLLRLSECVRGVPA